MARSKEQTADTIAMRPQKAHIPMPAPPHSRDSGAPSGSVAGRYDRLDARDAEVAFVVRDDHQGRGLGAVLLEHLAAAAWERGVRRFVAEVLPSNRKMLATFREAGYAVSQRMEDGIFHVRFDLEPTEQVLSVRAAREHRSEARSVERLLNPVGVAVIGASRTPGRIGHELLRHLRDYGAPGPLYAIHPEADSILDVPAELRPKSCFANTYARLWWERPSTTITRNFGTPSSSRCIHPLFDRGLTTREGARLQSFPDRYEFTGSRIRKNLQIGNAVPPLLAEALGREIFRALAAP